MEFANATKFNRKSGVAQWRDLLFSFCLFKRNLGRPKQFPEDLFTLQ